MQIELKPFL